MLRKVTSAIGGMTGDRISGPRWSIIVFAVCAAAVLAGLGSLTFYTLGLERREFQSRADARHQELLRLALWRMDSALTPLLTRESSRPFFEYESFVPANLGYGRIPGPIEPGQTVVPSPLLRPEEPLVKLYFSRSSKGLITSPQAPPATLRAMAEGVFMSSYDMEVAEQRVRALSELMGATPSTRLMRALATPAPSPGENETAEKAEEAAVQTLTNDLQSMSIPGITQSANEYRARQQVADTASQTRNTVVPGSEMARSIPATTSGTAASRQDDERVSQAPRTEIAEADAAGKSSEAGSTTVANPTTPPSTSAPASASPVASPVAPTDTPARDAALSVGASAMNAAAEATKRPQRAGADDEISRGKTGSNAHADADDPSGIVNPLVPESPAPPTPFVHEEPDLSAVLALAPMNPGVDVGRLTPRWFTIGKGREPELVFVREVTVEGERFEQGFWLDWPALRENLLASAGDLTPGATLAPLVDGVNEADASMLARTLAGIPAEFVVPQGPLAQVPLWSPARLTLLVTWCVSLLAILAIAMVLRAAMELAERRGRFVSAVTHELRTPLTTFCLYSQMLADGLIQGDEARATYLETLKSESQRLARIVESVLEYARLGRQRPGHVRTLQSVASLIEQIAPPLERRCVQAGMMFDVQIEGSQDPSSAMVASDAPTLERILYNLVDNACKYAAGATDLRVHLVASISESGVVFSVRDHGPGIEPAERPRVFRAFVRGSREAAGTIPGLGLGLALAHGLAKEIGAELSLAGAGPGARFDLRLPRA
jgi:signal transduction histidine kinase